MKKIGVITIVVLVLLAITYMLVGNYFYNYALNAKQEKEFLEDNPHLVETLNASGGVFATNEEKDASFVSNHKLNTRNINSFDKLKLTGYEYMNEQSSRQLPPLK